MKTGLFTLCLGLVAGFPSAGLAGQGTAVSSLKWPLPPVPVDFSSLALRVLSVEPRGAGDARGLRGRLLAWPLPRARYHGCGHAYPVSFADFPATAEFPDLYRTLGDAYLNCRLIRASLLDQRVSAGHFPEGHFGEWVYEGVLVAGRTDFTDETVLRHVFTLVMETVAGPEDLLEYWTGELDAVNSIRDYRKTTGFVPEMTFEFVGVVPVRVELNTAQERVLIQAGDKWGGYLLDRGSAAALRELLKAATPPGV
jgi:hypothetical protein